MRGLARSVGTRTPSAAPLGVLLALALAMAIGFTWGLPGPDSWSADSISPRSCGLGAIVETYRPGHFHIYPPLHMAILTVLSLPWMAVAAARAGTGVDALGAELVKPLYMSGIEASARALAGLMALAIAWQTMRLWSRTAGRRAGVLAGAVVALNATFVYYAHTGNLEVPHLFWISWALVEIDRVAAGEPRETQALLLATAAVLTKDQAAAAFLLPVPVYLAILPKLARGEPVIRRRLLKAAGIALVAYAVVSGAVVNPSGFRARIDVLLGPASQSWTQYPRGLGGALSLAWDAVRATPHFASWPLGVLALAGIAVVVRTMRGVERARALLPLATAVSFAVFFTFSARRSEDRFLLPESLFFFPYAAVALDRAWSAWPRWRPVVAASVVVAVVPALVAVASMDATLLADPRYEGEHFLSHVPAGTHVEVYGSAQFLPRLPSGLVVVRPGVEPVEGRRHMDGVTELLDPELDPRPRDPALIVLATELSSVEMTWVPPYKLDRYGKMDYRDAVSKTFFHGLLDGSLGYERVLRATCRLPWPLECREIHHSTAGELWIYSKRGDSRFSASGTATELR